MGYRPETPPHANLERKPFTNADRWTADELNFFRISQNKVDCEEFFGKPFDELRKPQFVDPGYNKFFERSIFDTEIFTNATDHYVEGLMDAIRGVHLRNWASTLNAPRDYGSIMDQLVERVLSLAGFDCHALLRLNHPITLEMGGEENTIHIDLGVVSAVDVTLLCMQDKRAPTGQDPFFRLMACAIASFQSNNRTRNFFRLPAFKTMIFPALIFQGSLPHFYRIHITEELADAVRNGVRPANATEVAVFPPPVLSGRMMFGLSDESTRLPVFTVLENLKDFLMMTSGAYPEKWNEFISDEETLFQQSSNSDDSNDDKIKKLQ